MPSSWVVGDEIPSIGWNGTRIPSSEKSTCTAPAAITPARDQRTVTAAPASSRHPRATSSGKRPAPSAAKRPSSNTAWPPPYQSSTVPKSEARRATTRLMTVRTVGSSRGAERMRSVELAGVDDVEQRLAVEQSPRVLGEELGD